MKKILLPAVCISALFHAQSNRVGINTTTPEKELHVNGTMKTKGIVLDNNFEVLGAAENYNFIIKSPAPNNKITSYNETFLPTSPAPINMIQFKITCDTDDNDWVNEFDTQINAGKFLVVIASYGYTLPTSMGASSTTTPIPQIYAHTDNNSATWKIKADYQSSTPTSTTTPGVWTLNLIVFDRAYTAQFDPVINMNGNGTGAAVTALIQ